MPENEKEVEEVVNNEETSEQEIDNVEEIKETTEVEKVEENDDGFYGPVDFIDEDNTGKVINEARTAFASVHASEMKKNRIIGIAFMIVMVGVVAVAYFFKNIINYMFIAVGVFFVGVLILTRLSRKKMDGAVADYLDVYSRYSDSYVYSSDSMEKIEMAFKAKPAEEVVRSMDFKENVFHVGSRDTIRGYMNEVYFETSDVSIKTGDAKDKKTHKTVFVGKMVNLKTSLTENGRILMYRKGCGDAEPDKLADVNKVEVENLNKEWVVYTSNNEYKKVFSKDMVDALNQLSTDETLNDIIVSIQKERTLIGLSYTDDLMIIPMDNEFKMDGVTHYKKDMEKVCLVAKAINKNKHFVK